MAFSHADRMDKFGLRDEPRNRHESWRPSGALVKSTWFMARLKRAELGGTYIATSGTATRAAKMPAVFHGVRRSRRKSRARSTVTAG